jgi:hypothetical protein
VAAPDHSDGYFQHSLAAGARAWLGRALSVWLGWDGGLGHDHGLATYRHHQPTLALLVLPWDGAVLQAQLQTLWEEFPTATVLNAHSRLAGLWAYQTLAGRHTLGLGYSYRDTRAAEALYGYSSNTGSLSYRYAGATNLTLSWQAQALHYPGFIWQGAPRFDLIHSYHAEAGLPLEGGRWEPFLGLDVTDQRSSVADYALLTRLAYAGLAWKY